MIWLIFLLIIVFLVIPASFLLIGVFRRNNGSGFSFFMVGILILSIPLAEFILILFRWFWRIPANSDNGEILFLPIFFALMYGGFQLYKVVQYYPYNTLVRNVKRIVVQMSDARLPSCVTDVTYNVLINASLVRNYHTAEETACYAVLIACMNLIATRKYHSIASGELVGVGKQLMYVSQNCLRYLFAKKVIEESRLSAFQEELNRLSFYDDRFTLSYMDF